MQYVADLQEYAAVRKPRLQEAEDSLLGSVRYALRRHDEERWADALIRRVIRLLESSYRQESGRRGGAGLVAQKRALTAQLKDALEKTKPDPDRPEQARNIAASFATAALAAATVAAAKDSDEPDLEKVWIDMDDPRVRLAHRNVFSVPLGEKFDVDGVEMDRPGDMSAPIGLWINCRCILGIRSRQDQRVAASDTTLVADAAVQEDTMTDTLEAPQVDHLQHQSSVDPHEDTTVYWHGVLAPEGVVSGDRRRFKIEKLTWRDLPLNLSWQKVNSQGHDGSVVIGLIDHIERDDKSYVWAGGRFLDTPEANEYIGMRAEGAMYGVSVDVDAATMSFADEDGNEVAADAVNEKSIMDVEGRISGATACAIPAFMEARIELGKRGDVTPETEALVASGDCVPCQFKAGIDEGTWDGSPGGYTDQEWFDATIIHLGSGPDRLVKSNNKLPIYTPSGKLSRAGVHAAASRLNQVDAPPAKISAAKGTLRGAYDVLGEDPPDAIKAAGDDILEFGEFGEFVKTEDGPGWLTHPVDTERLRRYWTKGKGRLKIRWGVPGDFNRCRMHLAKYIKPQYLNGYCANRHYDALGFWPGRPVAGDTVDFGQGDAFHLVAAGWDERPPKEWFEDPHLTGPSAISVTESGRVFGHLATWGTCHLGFKGECVMAPASPTDYAYFKTGVVLTDGGEVAVGHITMGTGHANTSLTAGPAMEHYDNTGTVVADVAVGEDEFGIYVAGWMRPGATEEHKYQLRAATLSGDWRSIGAGLELVAALAVNVPGFPIPRTQIVADGGRQTALVASGVVPVTSEEVPDVFDIESFARETAKHLHEIQQNEAVRARMDALAQGLAKKRMAAVAAGRK